MISVKVKICGITRAEDRDVAIAAGADALGFVFTPRSKRCLDATDSADLVRNVPAFIDRVGLFMDQEHQQVEEVLKQIPLSLLQFHGSEDPGFCSSFGLPYIKAVSMDDPAMAEAASVAYAEAAGLLLDSHASGQAGGTGEVFDWNVIPHISRPLILAGGLNPGNVHSAVQQVRPWAVDVSSGVETAPGIKDSNMMIEFIREARREQ